MLRQLSTLQRAVPFKAATPVFAPICRSNKLTGRRGQPSEFSCQRSWVVNTATADGIATEQQPVRVGGARRKNKRTKESAEAFRELKAELEAKRVELKAEEAFDDLMVERIAKYCYTNVSDLKVLRGVTHEAVDKYGEAFLEVVKDFRANRDNGRLKPLTKPGCLEILQTRRLRKEYLTRFTAGETITQIAEAMKVPTDFVVGDLACFFAGGQELDQARLAQEANVTPEVFKQVVVAMDKAGEDWLSKIKMLAGPSIDYGQIKVVAALKARNISV